MGRQIVKQPDGKFAVWSSVVDHIILYDCSREDLLAFEVEERVREIWAGINVICDALDQGGKPSFQFTKSWEDCLRIIRGVHGAQDATYQELIAQFPPKRKARRDAKA